jgi:hypothetical protein
MRSDAATVDFHLGSLAASAIDLNEGILAVADNFNPVSFVAIVVDLNARSLFARRAIVAGYLCRAARDDQSGERNKHPSD